jgi:tetratricopeptide (TPR) repeat protein
VRDALELGQPSHALELLDRLWGNDLSREDCWFLRGQALYGLQRFLDAGRISAEGLERAPQSVALLYLLCNCEAQLNDLAAAEHALVRALALLPGNMLLVCRYVHLLARQGRLAEAEAQLERATLLDPDFPLVEQERRFLATLAGSGGVTTDEQIGALIRESADPYGRAPLALSLLGPVPRPSAPTAAAGDPRPGALRIPAAPPWLVPAAAAAAALTLLLRWLPG